VDPRVHPEQPGWSREPVESEDGVNYLRRLKGGLTKPAPAASDAKSSGTAPAATAGPGWNERRQSPRYRCSGSAEFRVIGSDVRMWGTVTDISLHGCYVEMDNTLPVNTKISLVLNSCGIRIRVAGTIRTSYPALGMGISFAEFEAVELANLKRLLASLVGHFIVPTVVAAPENALEGAMDVIATADPTAFIEEITTIFQKKTTLSREDFCHIAKRVRRS